MELFFQRVVFSYVLLFIYNFSCLLITLSSLLILILISSRWTFHCHWEHTLLSFTITLCSCLKRFNQKLASKHKSIILNFYKAICHQNVRTHSWQECIADSQIFSKMFGHFIDMLGTLVIWFNEKDVKAYLHLLLPSFLTFSVCHPFQALQVFPTLW